MDKCTGPLEHPLPLTIVLIYSAVASVALTTLPPIRWPFYFSDVLAIATIVHFATLILITYSHGASTTSYEVRLFVLKGFVAVIYSYQFRLLEEVGKLLKKGNSPQWPLVVYYSSSLALIGTMFFFANWTHRHMTPHAQAAPWRYYAMRIIGIAVLTVGILGEFFNLIVSENAIRWGVAVAISIMNVIYFSSRPWKRFVHAST
jgi:hypothetical protein